MRLLLVTLLLLLFGHGPAIGDDLPGQDDARFTAALALWLDDDEATALPALAALAAEGNRAAQVLLARIDVRTVLHGPWLALRSREERVALMRAPGGRSGRSWMQVAAGDTPLARLHVEASRPGATAATALALVGMGEAGAGREALHMLATRQYDGFAEVAGDPRYPPEMRYLVWREWADRPDGRDRIEAEIAAMMPGDPQIRRHTGGAVAHEAFDAWLAETALAAPLRTGCAVSCPASGAACTRAAWALVKRLEELWPLGSPSETLIPAEVWNASPRAGAAVLRQAWARYDFAYVASAKVAAADACLGAALDAEVARVVGAPR